MRSKLSNPGILDGLMIKIGAWAMLKHDHIKLSCIVIIIIIIIIKSTNVSTDA
jgi:hypothetical protein